ncbi:MAG: DUF937 domain-containing protein [Salaquimonas sp.]
MNPLFDMLSNLQNEGQAPSLQNQMAKQFGLQQEQASKAIEALMPAFTQGLKRNAAASPSGMASFMEALAKGNHANYVQNPMEAFTSKGMSEGNAILGHLFGSKEVSRAVTAQAEAASGVSQSILKQMLPALAPIVMGSLFKQMTGQVSTPQAQNAFGGGGGILGQILQEMMKGGLGGGQSAPQNQPRAKNPLESILEQMTGGGGFGGGSENAGNPGGALGDIFNEMIKNGPMGGAMGDQPQNPSPQTSPYDEPENDLDDVFGRKKRAREADPYAGEPASEEPNYPKGTGLEDLFGDLFKPSKQGVPQYDKAIESIFDQFMKPRS